MKAKHVLWLVFLSLLLCSCSSVRNAARSALGLHPRFDTWEEADEYLKKHPEAQQELQEQAYNNNYYFLLSWAKEGMDESTFRSKIGANNVSDCLQSTYSSMGSTVRTYKFQLELPDDGYKLVTAWLTFIDGKLFSISTFNR